MVYLECNIICWVLDGLVKLKQNMRDDTDILFKHIYKNKYIFFNTQFKTMYVKYEYNLFIFSFHSSS